MQEMKKRAADLAFIFVARFPMGYYDEQLLFSYEK